MSLVNYGAAPTLPSHSSENARPSDMLQFTMLPSAAARLADLECRARRIALALPAMAAFCAGILHATPGRPGTLDPSFAASSPLGFGKVMSAVGAGANWGRAVALQSDGKAIMAGACQDAGGIFQFCVARYRADGVLDTSWNSTGTVLTSIGSSHYVATAVVVQPDGKVIVTGKCNDGTGNVLCVARYTASGTLDNTWNGTGYGLAPLRGEVAAAAIQADGKIIVAVACLVSDATHTDFDLCATRFTSSGVVNTTWNNTGSVTLNGSDWDDHGQAVVVQPDGKVILAGYCNRLPRPNWRSLTSPTPRRCKATANCSWPDTANSMDRPAAARSFARRVTTPMAPSTRHGVAPACSSHP